MSQPLYMKQSGYLANSHAMARLTTAKRYDQELCHLTAPLELPILRL